MMGPEKFVISRFDIRLQNNKKIKLSTTFQGLSLKSDELCRKDRLKTLAQGNPDVSPPNLITAPPILGLTHINSQPGAPASFVSRERFRSPDRWGLG